MTFLNPLVLLGLAAAAIPLLIHLFHFRRPRKVDFSSLVFLRELQKSTMQRMKIRQYLLLALRMLAVAALVLAFARPAIKGSFASRLGGRIGSSAVIVVDNSPSMTMRDMHGEYLAQARQIASGIVGQMRGGDEVFVKTTGDTVQTSAPYAGRNAAQEAIARIKPAQGTASVVRMTAGAADILKTRPNANREIYLISDFHRSSIAETLATAIPPDVRVILVPVGGRRAHANVGITDVQVASRIVEQGQPVRFEATLVNYGKDPVKSHLATLHLAGQPVAQASADLPPGRPVKVTFVAAPRTRGWLDAFVQTEGDDFVPDDRRYFTLHVPEHRRLLLVEGQGQRTDYVSLALSPTLTRDRVQFEITRIPQSALAARPLNVYDAILLVGPAAVSAGEAGALARYVAEGGGLLFYPGGGGQDYSNLFAALGGGRQSGYTGTPGGETIGTFGRIEREHTLFDGVFEERNGASVERPVVTTVMNYIPGRGTEQTLIRLSNGLPFLQEIRHGSGVVLLVASALDPAWSDLPHRGLFIPLLYRSVFYASSAESVTGEQLVAGSGGELRLSGLEGDRRLTLVGQSGQEYALETRTIFGAALAFVDPSVRTPGVYDVRAGTETIRRVAVNPDARESDLTVLRPEEARLAMEKATGRPTYLLDIAEPNAVSAGRSIIQQRTGVEIWNVLLVLALIFLILEMIVARIGVKTPERAVAESPS